jgi:hypothetical protein
VRRQQCVYDEQREDCAVKSKPPSPRRASDHF